MKKMILSCVPFVLFSGCGPLNCPFHDRYAHRPPITTPSVEAAVAADVEPAIQQRRGVEKVRWMEDGTVVHGPLWFEDPSEEHGSEDGHFTWTGEDYLWIAKWRARFLANLIALPGSAVVNPPWQRMVSDGGRSCCGRGRIFDAEPAVSTATVKERG